MAGPGGFRSLYTEDWKLTTRRDFVTFWYDTVTDNDIREIIGPDTLRTEGEISFATIRSDCINN